MISSIELLRCVPKSLRRVIYRLACACYLICRPFVGAHDKRVNTAAERWTRARRVSTTGLRGSTGSVYIHNGPDTAGVLQHTAF